MKEVETMNPDVLCVQVGSHSMFPVARCSVFELNDMQEVRFPFSVGCLFSGKPSPRTKYLTSKNDLKGNIRG